MTTSDEFRILRIKNALKTAYDNGIEYSEAAYYMMGYGNVEPEVAKKLDDILEENVITIESIKNTMELNNYDIRTIVKELEDEHDFAVQDWIKIIEEGLENIKTDNETKKEEEKGMKKYDEKLMQQILRALKSAHDQGIEYSDIEAYMNGGTTVGTDNKEFDRILYINGITKIMINNFMRRNDYDMAKLIDEIENENVTPAEPKVDEKTEKKEDKQPTLAQEDIDEILARWSEEQGKNYPKPEIENPEIILEDLEDLIVEKLDEEDLDNEGRKAEEELDEENEQPELTEKSKKLMKKVEILTEKIEQEKNPLKRHFFAFRVKMLIAKIQKEIDLQNMRQSYKLKREQLKANKQESEMENVDKISMTTAEIKQLKKELKGNEEYDYESSKFMYPKEYVEKNGGIEEFAEKLKESKSVETQNAAAKIESMAVKRQQLEELEDDLKTYKDELRDSDKNYDKQVSSLNFKEKSLVVVEKVNIFSKIKLAFSNITGQVREYFEERKENKLLKAEQLKEQEELEEAYNQQIAELKEQLEQAKQELKEKNESERQDRTEEKGKDMAASFREQMSDMTKYSQPPIETEEDEHSGQPESETIIEEDEPEV